MTNAPRRSIASSTSSESPASAAIIPQTGTTPKLAIPIPEPDVSVKLKGDREQQDVIAPLVQYLKSINWKLDQIKFGKKE